jgi:hypothetical protein
MRCENIEIFLSPFLDEVLDEDQAKEVSKHLEVCSGCQREFARLARLRRALGSLGKVQTPDYLHHLVQRRITAARENSWRTSLRDALEYQWSIMRTMGSLWYLTRLMGTVATFVLFIAITAAIKPFYFDLSQLSSRAWASSTLPQKLGVNVLKNLGMPPLETQKRPISSSDPQINDLYLLNLAQNASRAGQNDNLSVVAAVDRTGAAKIQGILEYPADSTLLSDVNRMIQSSRWRPATQNGKAVDSHLVLLFSKVSVYD